MTNNTAPLADLYAAAKAELEAAEAKVKAIRAEILATGCDAIHGDTCTVTVSLSERETFNGKLAKTFLTEDQIAACTGSTLVETLRIKAALAKAA